MDASQATARQQAAADALDRLVDTSITDAVQRVGLTDAALVSIPSKTPRQGLRRAATASDIDSAARLVGGAPAPPRRRTTAPGAAAEPGEPSPRGNLAPWATAGPLQQQISALRPRRTSAPGSAQRRVTAPGVRWIPLNEYQLNRDAQRGSHVESNGMSRDRVREGPPPNHTIFEGIVQFPSQGSTILNPLVTTATSVSNGNADD